MGCHQGGQTVIINLKVEGLVLLAPSRCESCVHKQCNQVLAQPCLLQSVLLSSEVVTALLHNLQHTLNRSILHVRGIRLSTSGLPTSRLPASGHTDLAVCVFSDSLVMLMLMLIAQVGSHGNSADVLLICVSKVSHHIAGIGDVCLHCAVH